MKVEEIALRQEVRQMLSEAGINKTVLKQLVKDVIDEEVNKAIKQAIAEQNWEVELERIIDYRAEEICKVIASREIGCVVRQKLMNMKIEVSY